MEKLTLQQELKNLEDKRRGQGRRHSIDVVLILTIMATMSGYFGYRAIGDFAARYKQELCEYFNLEKQRVPAYATVRRVLMSVDPKRFGDIFTKWMKEYLVIKEDDWVSVDGKAIRGTKQQEEDKKLSHLVSFFKNDSKEVITARQTASKSNEIPLVQEMIKEFPLDKLIITLDALHCQSETLKMIKEKGNDYVVQVKENQKKLAQQIEFNSCQSKPISTHKETEPNRDRIETREVFVYDDLYNVDTSRWCDVVEFVKVVRTTYCKKTNKESIETSFYISSKTMDAKTYNQGIRSHWAIENSLHFVKDVTFGEDASLVRTGNAPTNFSIIRNFSINLLRRLEYSSLKQAIRLIGGNIKAIGGLLLE